jgi:hypothetical protein
MEAMVCSKVHHTPPETMQLRTMISASVSNMQANASGVGALLLQHKHRAGCGVGLLACLGTAEAGEHAPSLPTQLHYLLMQTDKAPIWNQPWHSVQARHGRKHVFMCPREYTQPPHGQGTDSAAAGVHYTLYTNKL